MADMGNDNKKRTNRKLLVKGLILAGVLVAVVVAVMGLTGLKKDNGGSVSDQSLFKAKRGDLVISVTESGDIKALKSHDIKSQVEGRTTIISIIDEGTMLTEEDVANGRILVELDGSEIEQQLTQQEVTFRNAEASFTEATESLNIQKKQNESDIETGKLNVRFALMDFKKYLGEDLAIKLSEDPNTSKWFEEIPKLLVSESLAGAALQHLRELEDQITLAEMKSVRADNQLKGTKRLFEKEYVSATELEGDELEAKSLQVQVEQTKTDLRLFKMYEFSKETERLLSDYCEAMRELDRIEASARSKLAQAESKLASQEATYKLQKEKFEKLQKQMKACVIYAPAPGQVVYASSADRWGNRSQLIEVGAEIRERQEIIMIPDSSVMKVEIKVHENWIDKIKEGQKANISVAAFGDAKYNGEVIKKSPMADQQNWMNPSLKVYSTEVKIDGMQDSLKTGMTGKVEVIIAHLKDVISVPIQSVINDGGKKICYVSGAGGLVAREVETGAFNDVFVEIKSGVNEGEQVSLNPPRVSGKKG